VANGNGMGARPEAYNLVHAAGDISSANGKSA
jgi:hypothetical protein